MKKTIIIIFKILSLIYLIIAVFTYFDALSLVNPPSHPEVEQNSF